MKINNKKVLLFGAGSSATRFAQILLDKGCEVTVYCHRSGLLIPSGCTSTTSLHPDDLAQYSAAIISSATSTHAEYIKLCVNNNLPVLVDKPIAHSIEAISPILKIARKKRSIVMVGFNLRKLPIIAEIHQLLKENKLGKILHAELYVGQYLPSWRPQKDYRETYSASYKKGGGVALDLIHEIDLAFHLFPHINFKVTSASKISSLEIDTEDFVQLQSVEQPHVTVKLDYLNHNKTRRYEIVGEKGSITCDIFKQECIFRSVDQERVFTDSQLFNIPETYKTEIDEFLSIVKTKKLSTLDDRELGIDALKTALKARKQIS